MSVTVAEKSKAYRKRKAAKLQRLAAYEAALREIVAEANKFGTDAGLSYAAIIAEGALAADRFELENGA